MESAKFAQTYPSMPKTWSSDFCVTKKFLKWGIKHEVDTLLFGSSLCAIGNIVTSSIDFLGNSTLTVLTTGELFMYPAYIVWREFVIQMPVELVVQQQESSTYQISMHIHRTFASISQATAGTLLVAFYGLQAGLDFATTMGLALEDPIVIKKGDIHPMARMPESSLSKLIRECKHDEARKLMQNDTERAMKEVSRWTGVSY